ncbi:MAG: hypothetical protein ABI367_06755 [Mucilaginibacter sp.]
MSKIHFLNVLEGDCNIIQHEESGRTTVIDVSNAYDDNDTPEETAVKNSDMRHHMRDRTNVPSNKKDYQQKKSPDNPIDYLKNSLGLNDIFRFIITHPDMDHLDGIKDLFNNFKIACFWDTDNQKELTDFSGGGYNKEDWKFYKSLRDGTNTSVPRRTYLQGNSYNYFDLDNITILAPTQELIDAAVQKGNYNDSSYVLLYTPPKKGGGNWKILFGGDSEDSTWNAILANRNFKEMITDVDVLFAPHHGRDSGRSYDFLKTVNPKYTLFGNASSDYLAYTCYPKTRITNNQAGYVILDLQLDYITFYVKNFEFARDFKSNRGYPAPVYNSTLKAYGIESYYGR